MTKQPGAVARARLAFVNRREIPIPARIQPPQVSAWGLFVSPPTMLPGRRGPRRVAPAFGAGRPTAPGHLWLHPCAWTINR